MSHHPELHPNSYHYQGCIFSYLSNPYRYPHKICTFKGGYGSKYFFPLFSVMLETIRTLSVTKNHPFYEKIDFFKNHKHYFAQVPTPAWG